MLLLSIFVFFSARNHELQQQNLDATDEAFMGYDFSEGYTSLERSLNTDSAPTTTKIEPTGPITNWIARRREERRKRKEQEEAAEDQQMDEILSRVHSGGISSLTRDERALLERISARLRSKSTPS